MVSSDERRPRSLFPIRPVVLPLLAFRPADFLRRKSPLAESGDRRAIGPTMATTTTTTRLRAVGTCGEAALSGAEGKTPPPPPPPLRNGLTSRGIEDTGKINGYASNGHVHVSKQRAGMPRDTILLFPPAVPRPLRFACRAMSAPASRVVPHHPLLRPPTVIIDIINGRSPVSFFFPQKDISNCLIARSKGTR